MGPRSKELKVFLSGKPLKKCLNTQYIEPPQEMNPITHEPVISYRDTKLLAIVNKQCWLIQCHNSSCENLIIVCVVGGRFSYYRKWLFHLLAGHNPNKNTIVKSLVCINMLSSS